MVRRSGGFVENCTLFSLWIKTSSLVFLSSSGVYNDVLLRTAGRQTDVVHLGSGTESRETTSEEEDLVVEEEVEEKEPTREDCIRVRGRCRDRFALYACTASGCCSIISSGSSSDRRA